MFDKGLFLQAFILTFKFWAMLNALIIEDEKPVADNLISSLASVADDVNVTARLSSVRESIEYLSHKPAVDLIFSDVQLSDGQSFEIFNQYTIRTPVIFVTGNNDFMRNAFLYNGIDYLLKPIDKDRLQKALAKYRMLKSHFNSNTTKIKYARGQKKKRMLLKSAGMYISLLLKDIVLFQKEEKHIYVLDRLGCKYIVDKTLGELEAELDEYQFFRGNRQYIINIDFIRSYKSYERVKLEVELSVPLSGYTIIISQETASMFKSWMHQA